jgi:uncharacterized SAM-binding protein YcdF (DUF218 family)
VLVNLIITVLVVPPGNLLLLAIAGFLMMLRRRRGGSVLLGVSLAGLLLLAMPVVAGTLLSTLETGVAPPVSGASPPGAIVILSGDIHHLGGVEPQAGIGPLTLERLRAGALLYRATRLPVLTTGGIVGRDGPPLADLMAWSLKEDFAVPTRWVEDGSHTTWENAELSAAILKSEGIASVFLVTQAWHMRRAMVAFERFGIVVNPAPVSPDKYPGLRPINFFPTVSAWLSSYYALHEWIGCAWYTLRARWS